MSSEETATRVRIERLETEVRDLKQIVADLEERLATIEKYNRTVPPFMRGPGANNHPLNDGSIEITHPSGPQI